MKEIIKKPITRDIITNIIYTLLVVAYIICFNTQAITLETGILTQYINISSLVFLGIAIIIIEMSYKKENKKLALYGIEFLILAIFTLLIKHAPKMLGTEMVEYTQVGMYAFIIYYVLKSIILFTIEKQKQLKDLSDIKDIVKEEPSKKEAKRKNIKEEGNEND